MFNPPLEKAALVRFYIMNGPTTKFRTETIKRQNQVKQLYANSYEGKQNKLECNSGVQVFFGELPPSVNKY